MHKSYKNTFCKSFIMLIWQPYCGDSSIRIRLKFSSSRLSPKEVTDMWGWYKELATLTIPWTTFLANLLFFPQKAPGVTRPEELPKFSFRLFPATSSQKLRRSLWGHNFDHFEILLKYLREDNRSTLGGPSPMVLFQELLWIKFRYMSLRQSSNGINYWYHDSLTRQKLIRTAVYNYITNKFSLLIEFEISERQLRETVDRVFIRCYV